MLSDEKAAPGRHPGSGQGKDCAQNSTPSLAPQATGARVIPIGFARRIGGPMWRRLRGLQSIKDLTDDYLRTHFYRDPALIAPLPEDRRGTR